MKRALIGVAAVLVLGGLIWLLWLRSANNEEEAQVETEVAVRVGQITRATLRSYVTAYGVVEPEPPGVRAGASARITPAVAGVVVAVTCVEGRRVSKGTVLFQLDSRLADAALEKARSAADLAAAGLERQKKLAPVEGTSQKALLEAEQALASARSDLATARTQLALLRVEAPLAGTITRVHVRIGEAVEPATTLADLVDPDRLVVSANVPSAELAGVRSGQLVEVSADQQAPPLKGTVIFVSPEVDPKTDTALVRATLAAPGPLRPGQLVTVRIVSAEHKDRLAIPIEGLVADTESGTVISLVRDGKARQKPVTAGLRDAGLVEVEAEGLQAGMAVVTEGAYGLPKETKIRVLNP